MPKNTDAKRVSIQAFVAPELKAAIKELAKADGNRSESNMVEKILLEYLDKKGGSDEYAKI